MIRWNGNITEGCVSCGLPTVRSSLTAPEPSGEEWTLVRGDGFYFIHKGQEMIAEVHERIQYAQLMCAAPELYAQLAAAVLMLDNLPGLSIDTMQMRRVLAKAKSAPARKGREIE